MGLASRLAIVGLFVMSALCAYWTLALDVGRLLNGVFTIVFFALGTVLWSRARRGTVFNGKA